ncbi:MAG: amylo-alpha-1,6-glucosidase [Candidatus Nanohaloarchaea archaeon]
MEYTLYENLSERKGVVSNLHGFLNRFADTGFKTKWSGYWVPPYKFLDYYGIKVNGIWLGPDSLDCTEYGEKFVFHHETDSLKITEVVEAPDSIPGFRVKLDITNKTGEKKAVQTVLEPGVDIRHKSEDIGPENYDIDEGTNRLTVGRDGRKLMISSPGNFDLKGEGYTKNHKPGERQRCHVPGQLVFRHEIEPGLTETVEAEFTTSGGSFQAIESRQQDFQHRNLGHVFNSSINSMENLVYDRNGLGMIAGHPWFQEYWARDTFWSLLGLIDAGYFEVAEEILENFTEKDRIDSLITLDDGDGMTDYPRFDGSPLFVKAVDKLDRHYAVNQELRQKAEEVMDKLELEDGVVQHHPKATWMDTLERGPAVDIQALWLAAAETLDRDAGELESGLEKFKEDSYMKDHLGEDAAKTINPAVPLMFGQVEEKAGKRYLEKINAEFSSRYGARTRSMADPGYDSSGYHTGSVWGLTTAWAAAANFEYGNYQQGVNFLEKLGQFLDRDQLGALPELVDAETGDLLGCSEQAWSAGLFVHVIDSYLLGIDVRDDHVRVEPAGDISGIRTGKRIGDEEVDLRFEDGEVEVLGETGLDIRTGKAAVPVEDGEGSES